MANGSCGRASERTFFGWKMCLNQAVWWGSNGASNGASPFDIRRARWGAIFSASNRTQHTQTTSKRHWASSIIEALIGNQSSLNWASQLSFSIKFLNWNCRTMKPTSAITSQHRDCPLEAPNRSHRVHTWSPYRIGENCSVNCVCVYWIGRERYSPVALLALVDLHTNSLWARTT